MVLSVRIIQTTQNTLLQLANVGTRPRVPSPEVIATKKGLDYLHRDEMRGDVRWGATKV